MSLETAINSYEQEHHLLMIDILPDDGDEAMESICCLVANMIMSINDASKEKSFELIEKYLNHYKGINNE